MRELMIMCMALIATAVTACTGTSPSPGTQESRLHNAPSPIAAYTFEDVEITAAEFDSAALFADQWQYIRSEREPMAEDTVIAREWCSRFGWEFSPEVMDECCYFYAFEGAPLLEMCGGDYCETRFLDDTTNMVGANMKLAVHAIGGVVLAWGCGDMFDNPEYVYIYPIDHNAEVAGKPYIGKPYIYETTPKWVPTGDHFFWGADSWFYVEGFNQDDETVYHKVRPIDSPDRQCRETEVEQ